MKEVPRSQEPQSLLPEDKLEILKRDREFYIEFKAQKDDKIYLLSFISKNDEEFRENTIKKLVKDGYINIKQVHHRKKRPKDKEDIKLLEILPKKYEVSFRINLDGTKYDKIMIIESTDEKKVADLLKQRCKREFSKVRNITKIKYRLANENSKESSKVVKEPKLKSSNKVNKKDTENVSKVNLKFPDNLTVISSIPKEMRLHADHEELDTLALSDMNIKEDFKEKQFTVTPKSIMINYSDYKWYIVSVSLSTNQQIWPTRVFAKSSSNALMMFSAMIGSKEDLRDIVLEYARTYSVMEESTGKSAIINMEVIGKIIKDLIV